MDIMTDLVSKYLKEKWCFENFFDSFKTTRKERNLHENIGRGMALFVENIIGV